MCGPMSKSRSVDSSALASSGSRITDFGFPGAGHDGSLQRSRSLLVRPVHRPRNHPKFLHGSV